jgi:uncharacterized membrane protein
MLVITVLSIAFLAQPLFAQTLVEDTQVTMKAKVLEILSQRAEVIPGTDTEGEIQELKIEILDGPEAGSVRTIVNDYIHYDVGAVFYLIHSTSALDATDHYAVSDPYRIPLLSYLAVLLVILVVIFGGLPGIRGLVSLVASLAVILYVLLPAIMAGYSPAYVSMGVASIIIVFGSYVTHGFNRTTTAAVLGMIGTILFTGFLSMFAVHALSLTGLSSDEAMYVHLNSRGAVDLAGLLLGGILIGLLGVLYDGAIGQAIAVEELFAMSGAADVRRVFFRALRIGREHIGALVNTLAIAYVGASLPLLLLFYQTGADVLVTINREIFAEEILRIILGSIGLVLVVPFTTAVSILLLRQGTISTSHDESSLHKGHHH